MLAENCGFANVGPLSQGLLLVFRFKRYGKFTYKIPIIFFKRFVILLTFLDIKGFPLKLSYNSFAICRTVLRGRLRSRFLFCMSPVKVVITIIISILTGF